ncbi:MAG TPA: helix-turn-helix transcriptional regulator [Neobacillus sp.]|jgi:XRE family transcriptional regulator of biofilm formation
MIGNNIYEIRKKRGFTLSELAEKANISKSYLSNIERNLNQNPSIHVITKLADVLDVDLNVLIKVDTNEDGFQLFDIEWIDFVNELKKSGIEKEDIQQYRTLIEFIKWKNRN